MGEGGSERDRLVEPVRTYVVRRSKQSSKLGRGGSGSFSSLSSFRFPSLFSSSLRQSQSRVAAAPWGSNACPPSAPCSLVAVARSEAGWQAAVEERQAERQEGRGGQWRRGGEVRSQRRMRRRRRPRPRGAAEMMRIGVEGGTPRHAAGGRQLRARESIRERDSEKYHC